MTRKERILNALRQNLQDIFCRNIEGEEREDLEAMIQMFVGVCDTNLTAEEMMGEFTTQEKLVSLFNGFREVRSETDAPTIH